jgi:hypothetical protein
VAFLGVPLGCLGRPSEVIGSAIPFLTSLPTISGSPVVGQTLTESNGTWTNSAAGYSYQWLRCDAAGSGCSAIPGATGQSYPLAAIDLGATLRVIEVADNAFGTGSAATSNPSAVVLSPLPAVVSPPTITGRPFVGATLTESHGAWTNSPAGFTYEWLRCTAAGASCSLISGATDHTYTRQSADLGSRLEVRETATNGYGSGQATSAQTDVVHDPDVAATVRGVWNAGDRLLITTVCVGPAGTCRGTITIAGVISACGTRIVSANARCRSKSKPRIRSAKVGQASISVRAGQTSTALITLNKTGRSLLERFYRLTATVRVSGEITLRRSLTFSYQRVTAFVSWNWAYNADQTLVKTMTITGLPKKAQVVVACHGPGCPFATRRVNPLKRTLQLAGLFGGHGLRPRAVVQVTISAPDSVAKVLEFTIRQNAGPSIATRCQPPGARRPAPCAG